MQEMTILQNFKLYANGVDFPFLTLPQYPVQGLPHANVSSWAW
jgi:hypothetical protein